MRYYHETLKAKGVKTHLTLLPAEFADSYCMGNSSDPAAKGSPYMDKTGKLPSGGGGGMGGGPCIDHTMGFPQVYQPLTKFLLEVLGKG